MKTKTRCPLILVLILLGLTVACVRGTPTPLAPSGKTPAASGAALADLTLYAQVAMDGYKGGCVAAYTPLVTQVCVENRGSGAAGAFVIQAEGGQGEWPLDKLGARETHCFQVDENLASVALTADPQNVVAESDEENNTWRAPIPTPPLICTPGGDAGSATPTPETAAPTPSPTLTPSPTPLPTLTPSPTPTPHLVATQSPLAITLFTLTMEDLPNHGKRITFNWATTGAAHVALYSHVQMRFPIWWDNQPANGSLTHDFWGTNYPNPRMTLTAVGPDGERVSQDIIPMWPCPYPYFFDIPLDVCAYAPASLSAAAEQLFEHGRMIWMQGISLDDQTTGGVIFVFYDTGAFIRYNDTWDTTQPESDPALTPPAGLQQPIRGFGKLWRENMQVREGLGWALNAEVGYSGAWQPQRSETIPSFAYIRTVDGAILRTTGSWESGSWQVWP